MRKNILTGIMLFFFFAVAMAGPAAAYNWGDIIIESEWGFGDNEALMVIDFSPGNGQDDSFAFLGKFSDASIDDFDLFDIVDDDPNLSYSTRGGGSFLYDVWYHDPDTGIDYAGVTPDDWSYNWWLSTKEYPGDDWGYDRIMEDGNIAGWCFTEYATWGKTPPIIPSAVPIPGAVWLLGSGLVGLIDIRKRRAV